MVVIIDPQSAGISGNMIVGALIDLGAHMEKTKEVMEYAASYFGEIEVNVSSVNKSGIQSTYVNVKCDDVSSIHYLEFLDRLEKINHELLDSNAMEMARGVFHHMAQAESQIHGYSLENVHFHEVGAADAVADVIGSVFAYFNLNLDKETVYGLPVALGGGIIEKSHGRLSVPAPATLNILTGAPSFGGPVNKELTTPTGAALLMSMVDNFQEFYPPFQHQNTGYGAGKMDLDFPNVLRISRGTSPIKQDKIVLLETNIDHLSGEVMGHIFKKLMGEGALDVTLIPTIMKKNRPGQLMRVICKNKDSEKVLDAIFRETGTLGIRTFPQVHRSILNRKIIPLDVDIQGKRKIRFKVGLLAEQVISARIEYDDARRVSEETGIPLKDVMEKADDEFKKYLNQLE
ncbi:nickel pincer cofactor biosynthesis protein LarC [Methanobacterium alcaliphilum]|uniref:nickel pincer cofactor biosynthesis protein LarC n=1 Tax=Methanobacterium alcaliphilum TaxID=392018 RepID=UPI002009F2D9|nr:nickel pincer cofactor biosynthesis protein LarC [Methanobacterium alcaliphilum]MCK9150558.1 nickel pincer cofactor biosynthesis protein LarC [Methanobacterium alcaliphilum]